MDVGLFGDGGFDPVRGIATFSGGPQRFGAATHYWDESSPAAAAVIGRLPSRFGFESSTVHTAELVAMVVALQWRQPGKWNLFVGDRSALFNVLERVSGHRHGLLQSSHSPLESRLGHILQYLHGVWACPPRSLHGVYTKCNIQRCGT